MTSQRGREITEFQERDDDVCECGDYRYQHRGGDYRYQHRAGNGPCTFNTPTGIGHGGADNFKRFMFTSRKPRK